MKASELRQKNSQELQDELLALHRQQFNLRMQKGSGQLSKPSEMQVVRRDIARIKTVLAEMATSENA